MVSGVSAISFRSFMVREKMIRSISVGSSDDSRRVVCANYVYFLPLTSERFRVNLSLSLSLSHRIGGVMVSVLAPSAVDRGFESNQRL
jgi:hypothetical protein